MFLDLWNIFQGQFFFWPNFDFRAPGRGSKWGRDRGPRKEVIQIWLCYISLEAHFDKMIKK